MGFFAEEEGFTAVVDGAVAEDGQGGAEGGGPCAGHACADYSEVCGWGEGVLAILKMGGGVLLFWEREMMEDVMTWEMESSTPFSNGHSI